VAEVMKWRMSTSRRMPVSPALAGEAAAWERYRDVARDPDAGHDRCGRGA
jgi:hypothetical protein